MEIYMLYADQGGKKSSVTGSLYVLTGPMKHAEKIVLMTIVANQNKFNFLSRVTNATPSGLNSTTKRVT
jgi:hypothetical protein